MKMFRSLIAAALLLALAYGSEAAVTVPAPVTLGGLPDYAVLQGNLISIVQQTNALFGNQIATVNATGAATLSAPNLLAGTINRTGATAGATDTTDTAANIIAQIGAEAPLLTANATGINQIQIHLRYVNSTNQIITLAAGSGVTVTGVTTVAPASFVDLILTAQSSTAVTFTAAGSGTTATSGITGTTTNNSAAAGYLGEIIESTVGSGSAVSLTSPNASNLTSVSLTAGDWDVSCTADHNLAGTTTLTVMQTGVSLTSATIAAQTGGSGLDTDPTSIWRQASAAPGGLVTQSVGPVRVSVASTTTVYCVAQDTFATSTDAVYGTLRARRVR